MNRAVDPAVRAIQLVDQRGERGRVLHVTGPVIDSCAGLPEPLQVLAQFPLMQEATVGRFDPGWRDQRPILPVLLDQCSLERLRLGQSRRLGRFWSVRLRRASHQEQRWLIGFRQSQCRFSGDSSRAAGDQDHGVSIQRCRVPAVRSRRRKQV